jgi:prophage DNA circulation protein
VDTDVLTAQSSGSSGLAAAVSSIKGTSNKDLSQVDADVLGVETTIDGAITASQGVVTAAVAASTTSIKGTPAKDNAQLSTEIAAVGTSAGAIPADLVARLDYLATSSARLLGLTKENSLLTNTFFDNQGNLTQGDMILYNSAADVGSPSATPLATYRITASWIGQKVQTYQMVKQP